MTMSYQWSHVFLSSQSIFLPEVFIYFVFYCFIHWAEALKNSFTERLARGPVAYTEQTLALVWVSTLWPGNSLQGSVNSGLAHPNKIIIVFFLLSLFFMYAFQKHFGFKWNEIFWWLLCKICYFGIFLQDQFLIKGVRLIPHLESFTFILYL